MSKKPNPVDFEKTIAELETLVEKMEAGDLSLEASLKCFERGIALTKACQETLNQAEQKISILLGKDDQARLEPFKPKENN